MASDFFAEFTEFDKLTPEQRGIFDQICGVLEKLRPARLDRKALKASLDGRSRPYTLSLVMPHAVDPEMSLLITIEPSEIVVSYGGFDHQHFDHHAGEDWRQQAVDFIGSLLYGSVEVDMRYGRLFQSATTYRLLPDGGREMVYKSGTLLPIFRWKPRLKTSRISFM